MISFMFLLCFMAIWTPNNFNLLLFDFPLYKNCYPVFFHNTASILFTSHVLTNSYILYYCRKAYKIDYYYYFHVLFSNVLR